MNKFTKMIEKLEDLVLAGFSVPFTSWTVVNGPKMVPLLDRIRESLPEEIRQAQLIIGRRDELLEQSQAQAKQILENARTQAETMLSESHLMSEVKREAETIRQQLLSELDVYRRKVYEEAELMKSQAYEEARATKLGANEYAEAVLASLDKNLAEFHLQVKNGQKHLRYTRQEKSPSRAEGISPLVGPSANKPSQPIPRAMTSGYLNQKAATAPRKTKASKPVGLSGPIQHQTPESVFTP